MFSVEVVNIACGCRCIQKEGWVVVPVLVSEWYHVLEKCEGEGNEISCLAEFISGITAEAVKALDEEEV
jgi:hypothetical protein